MPCVSLQCTIVYFSAIIFMLVMMRSCSIGFTLVYVFDPWLVWFSKILLMALTRASAVMETHCY